MSEQKIIIHYNEIRRTVRKPYNYLDLKNIFLEEFKEDNNNKYSFSYINFEDEKIDFNKLKNADKKTSLPIINATKIPFSNPNNLQKFKTLVGDANFNNTFIIFKSVLDIITLVYASKNNSIISYNMETYQKINEYKNAHEGNIIIFLKHYFDIINIKDLMISIGKDSKDLKIWNLNKHEIIYYYQNIIKYGSINAACILSDNNNICFIPGNFSKNYNEIESLKVYNLNGSIRKEIGDSEPDIYLIDSYYDIYFSQYYIITCNLGYVKSYDYKKNKVYHKYCSYDNWRHTNFIINNENKNVKLMESSYDGNIRIWNFHNGELLNQIYISDKPISFICLWNNEYCFVSCTEDFFFEKIDLNKGEVVKNIYKKENDYRQNLTPVIKIYHPIYGECLVFENNKNQIELWKN